MRSFFLFELKNLNECISVDIIIPNIIDWS